MRSYKNIYSKGKRVGAKVDLGNGKYARIRPFPLYVKFILKLLFPSADMNTVYAAFGRTVYESNEITEDLIHHECTHLIQQKCSYLYAIWWWIKYRVSKRFRYKVEREAYARQLLFIYENVKNPGRRRKIKAQVAEILSSPMYGNIVSFHQAMSDLP